MSTALALVLFAALPQDSPARPEVPLLLAPEGFTVELIDQAPDLRWPSAVHCRADGSLLVAEDPMDMPGPTDQPLDRIWLYRWNPQGGFTRTLFADKLYAAFGLEEFDGAVYVMNMPRLTALRDSDGDGVAEERRELITDLGPDAPGWPGGFNDHIVSGLRFHDGWLYVAVGDKGVPLAHGTDGSTLTLRGGGVIRLRPDGSQLELVATGLRNILDVAIDAQGELFTYDNTDDGLGWWTRLTHVVHGGFYGYPWDYHGPPDRFLPPLAEYGGGSPTGGLVKLHGGWPAPHEGSLFFCEWGDQTLRRFELIRDGGSFRVAAMEEFLRAGEVENFRPTDVAESPDGRFLYVSDWGFGGWTAKDVTGRLWRVGRAGDAGPGAPSAAPAPSETAESGAPQLLGRLRSTDPAELPARQRALRELARLADGSWTADPEARATAWRVAGESAIARHHWRSLAAGSLAPAQLSLFFTDGEAQALELLDAIGSAALRKSEMRRGPLESQPPRGPFEDLEACGLIGLARGEGAGANPRLRAKAVETLGLLARVPEPWDGRWWNIDPARRPRPARTLDWRGTEPALAALRISLVDSDAGVRRAAVLAADGLSDARLLPELQQRVFDEQDPDLRRILIELYGRLCRPEDAGLFSILARRATDLDLRMRALRIGARIAPELLHQSAQWILAQDATPPELASECLEVLAGIDLPLLEADRESLLDTARIQCSHPTPIVRGSASKLLAHLAPEEALPALMGQCRDAEVRAAAFATLAGLCDPRAARIYAAALADPDPELRSLARRTVVRARDELRERLEGMVARQEFEGAVVRELRTIYAGYQPITRWEIFGPFPVEGPEAALDFAAGRELHSLAALRATGGRTAASEREDGFVDLRALLGSKSNQAAFAVALVDSPAAREIEMRLGSDDQARAWLNGERVHDFDGARGFSAEADRFPVRLAAGSNRVVVRVGQIGGDWGFAVAVPEQGSGPIFETALPARPTAAEYGAFADRHPGDPTRGETVFRDGNRTLCMRCHAVGGAGESVGPDLTGIGARYSRSEILQSILAPSQRLAEGYAAAMVVTRDDQVLFGQVRRDDPRGVALVDSTGTLVEVERADVLEVRPSKLSVMPEGLCGSMSLEEFADLLAWLSSLR
ncbi:MAG: c-type cytochrome [Planctomycetes bacterium]|nr:c-type cytochrome [Planctomycetota bacterium]